MPSFEHNMSDSEATIELMQKCLQLIKKYQWLADSFVIDFFSQNIWETKVPESWRSALDRAKPSDLAKLLDYDQVDADDEVLKSLSWPQEILDLRTSVRLLGIPRKPISKGQLQTILGIEKPSAR